MGTVITPSLHNFITIGLMTGLILVVGKAIISRLN
jgi:hypothetical protein